jgi:hypothetical protein
MTRRPKGRGADKREASLAGKPSRNSPTVTSCITAGKFAGEKIIFLDRYRKVCQTASALKKSGRTNFSEGCLIKAGWVFTGPTLSRGTQTVTKPTKSARRHSLERDSARIRAWGQQSAIAFVWEELNHVRADYYLYELPDGNSAN